MPPAARKGLRGRTTAAVLRQTAIPLLIELARRGDWAVPHHVTESIGVPSNRSGATIKRLQRAGLIEVEVTGTRGASETKRFRITPAGARVAKHLESIASVLEPPNSER